MGKASFQIDVLQSFVCMSGVGKNFKNRVIHGKTIVRSIVSMNQLLSNFINIINSYYKIYRFSYIIPNRHLFTCVYHDNIKIGIAYHNG